MNTNPTSSPTTTERELFNEDTSIKLTKAAIVALLIASIALSIAGPWIVDFVSQRQTPLVEGTARRVELLTLGYVCAALAIAGLADLFLIVTRIGNGEVFSKRNVSGLRLLGWIVATAAIVTAIVGVTAYVPFLAVTIAAAFVTLIIRVVRNAFGKAVEMKDELDYTI